MDTRRRPATWIDEHGRRRVAPTWESLIERQLREAMDDGELARLDGLAVRPG